MIVTNRAHGDLIGDNIHVCKVIKTRKTEMII